MFKISEGLVGTFTSTEATMRHGAAVQIEEDRVILAVIVKKAFDFVAALTVLSEAAGDANVLTTKDVVNRWIVLPTLFRSGVRADSYLSANVNKLYEIFFKILDENGYDTMRSNHRVPSTVITEYRGYANAAPSGPYAIPPMFSRQGYNPGRNLYQQEHMKTDSINETIVIIKRK